MEVSLPVSQPSTLVFAHPELSAEEALKLVFRDYKPNTQRAYLSAFAEFQTWAQVSQLSDLQQLTSLKILEYKAYLKSKGRQAAGINQALSALKKAFQVLKEFDYIATNPFKTSVVRQEKIAAVSDKGALSLPELDQMIQANQREAYDPRVAELVRQRNGLILRFLYLTATRRSEVAALRWEDLQKEGRYFVAMLRQTKSGVVQRVKLRYELYHELLEWQEALKTAEINSDWVFPSLSFRTRGQQMTGKGINDVIARLGQAIGLDISAHYLRHTAITMALELGEPLQKVQAYARHTSANTTIRYYHDQEILQKNPTDRLPMI